MSKYRQPNKKNIIGHTFGFLLVLESTQYRTKKKAIIYNCLCDCGNKRLVSSDSLKRGKVTRCIYCAKKLKYENFTCDETKIKLANLIAEESNVSLITKHRANSNNTSGHKGVVYDKQRKKWRAQLVFQKKCYNLGRFENIDDAVQARLNAEKNIYKPFIEKYTRNYS